MGEMRARCGGDAPAAHLAVGPPQPAQAALEAFARRAGGCGLRVAERWLLALTVPIPLGLNLYFFRSLLKKALRTYAAAHPPSSSRERTSLLLPVKARDRMI